MRPKMYLKIGFDIAMRFLFSILLLGFPNVFRNIFARAESVERV